MIYLPSHAQQGVARVLTRTIAMLSGEDAWPGIRIFQNHELP